MRRIRRILIAVADPGVAPRTALRAAATLGRASGAALELFHAASPRSGESALRRLRKALERTARSGLLKGCRVRAEMVAETPAHEAIVRRVLASAPDLLVIAGHPRAAAKRVQLTRTDRELIRQCPCPLLIVKSARPLKGRAVLIAVDPFHAHAKPARLDPLLLGAGQRLAKLVGSTAHAFHAYMPLVASVQGPLGEPVMWESPAIEDSHTAQVRRTFELLAERAGIAKQNRWLALGDVPTQLFAAVRRLRAGAVVIGAVSRSALGRLLIGSTAERVLDRVPCDLLIIKPRGFVSTVGRRNAPSAVRG